MFGLKIRNGGGDPKRYVDFEGHVAPGVLRRSDESYVAVWRVEGLPWETLENDFLYARRNDANGLLVNISSPRIVLGAHKVRTLADDSFLPEGDFVTDFSRSLDEVYRERLTGGGLAPLYRNDQFFSITVRPVQPMGKTVATMLRSARLVDEESQEDAVKFLEDRAAIIQSRFKQYGFKRLGYRYERNGVFCEIAEAMVLMHSGVRIKVPVPDGPLGDSLYRERTNWGPFQSILIRGPDGRARYASAFGFKVPSTKCLPWVFDHLNAAPFCYAFSRHFHFLSFAEGEDTTRKKIMRMEQNKDPDIDQAEAMATLRARLMQRRSVMGNHHNVMTVFADSLDGLEIAAAEAHNQLAAGTANVVREDWVDLPAYWSHLPGNVHLWPRPMPVSSDNFASFASMSAYPIGPEEGRWGPPVTVYRSSGGTPVRQHFHVRDVGNFSVFGPTGGGKTVLVTHLLSQSERYRPLPQIVYNDQYLGAAIGIRAMKGDYNVLQDGVPTYFNPLKGLTDSPRDKAMLRFLARGMIGGEIGREDQRSIGLGIDMVMELPVQDRSWGEVRGFLGHERGGVGERLEQWCKGGEYGWALDCDEDRLSFTNRVTGNDTTGIVGNAIAKGPIFAYMSYRIETLIDGRRIIVITDEAHHWVEDPFWGRRAASLARTIRRRNGVFGLLTQHPADIAKSPFGHAIMQQMPQQFFFPDPRARAEDYVGGAQITESMLDIIRRRIMPGRGLFLRVVDGEAMVCELPLGGLDAHIAVLSSRDTTVKLAEEIRAEHGDGWLDQFMQRHAEAVT